MTTFESRKKLIREVLEPKSPPTYWQDFRGLILTKVTGIVTKVSLPPDTISSFVMIHQVHKDFKKGDQEPGQDTTCPSSL